MRQQVRLHLVFEGLSGWRICYREGNPADRTELMKVSAAMADDILILGTDHDGRGSDQQIIQMLLALGALPGVSSLAGDVFVEMQTYQNARVVSTVLEGAVGIVPRHTVNRMLVLRAVVPSVGYTFLDVVSFRRGDAMYKVPVPVEFLGTPFRDVYQAFPDAVVFGILPASVKGSVEMPKLVMDAGRQLQEGDNLLVLAPTWESANSFNREAIEAHGPLSARGRPRFQEVIQADGQLQLGPKAAGAKVVIIIGCPLDFPNVLQAFDDYLARGSEVHVLSVRTLAWRHDALRRYFGRRNGTLVEADESAYFKRISVKHHVGVPTCTKDLLLLPLVTADSALVLAEQMDQEAPVAVDSRNLNTVITLRGLLSEKRARKKCKVVTELLDPKSQQVLQRNSNVRSCGSFVYSNSIATGVFAMAAAEKEVYNLLLEFLDPHNPMAHISASLAGDLLHGTENLSYSELQRRVWDAQGGILLGWRRTHERYPVLNPKDKTARVAWSENAGDELITLRPQNGATALPELVKPLTRMPDVEHLLPGCVRDAAR